ncbi:sugar ABC transporter permease [Candidatus Bipolaricaulota bacterium]|nr:sugar ABC transporter permease [Candidatus Bipolaricaulota bacterium]
MRRYGVWVPLLFLLPAMGILFFLQFFVWSWNINIALHDVTLMNFQKEWDFVGLQNFIRVFTDPTTMASLKNTAIFTISSVSLQMFFGTAISYFLYRADSLVEKIFRPIIIIPWLSSVVVAAFSWKLMAAENIGFINRILSAIGFHRINFLGNSNAAMFLVVLASIWWGTPFVILLLSSAMTSLSPQLVEVAKIDGATEWIFFTRVALPILLPFLVVALILTTVWAFNQFSLVLLLTEGGPMNATRVFPLHGYQAAFDLGEFSYGSAVSLGALIMNMVLVYLYIKVSGVEFAD